MALFGLTQHDEAALRIWAGLGAEDPIPSETIRQFVESPEAQEAEFREVAQRAREALRQLGGGDVPYGGAPLIGSVLTADPRTALTPLTPEFLNSLPPERLESFFRYWLEKTGHGPVHFVAVNPSNSQKFIITPTSGQRAMVYVVQENRLRVFSWKGGEPFDVNRADHTDAIFSYASQKICLPLAEFFLGKGRTHKEENDTITQKARFGKNDYHTQYTRNGRTTEPVTKFITDGLTKEGFEAFERAEKAAAVPTAHSATILDNFRDGWFDRMVAAKAPGYVEISGEPFVFFESELGGILLFKKHTDGSIIVGSLVPITYDLDPETSEISSTIIEEVRKGLLNPVLADLTLVPVSPVSDRYITVGFHHPGLNVDAAYPFMRFNPIKTEFKGKRLANTLQAEGDRLTMTSADGGRIPYFLGGIIPPASTTVSAPPVQEAPLPDLSVAELQRIFAKGTHPDIIEINGIKHLYFEELKTPLSGAVPVNPMVGIATIYKGKPVALIYNISSVFGKDDSHDTTRQERKLVEFLRAVKQAHDDGQFLSRKAVNYYKKIKWENYIVLEGVVQSEPGKVFLQGRSIKVHMPSGIGTLELPGEVRGQGRVRTTSTRKTESLPPPAENPEDLIQKRGREKLTQALDAFNRLAPPRPSSSIPITWPGNNQPANTLKKIADWELPVSIQSGDPEAQTFRDVKLRLQKKEQKRLFVQWGERGALSSYRVQYRDFRGLPEIFLVPDEGAPQGVIRLFRNESQPTGLEIHEKGEILDHVYTGKYGHHLFSLEYDPDSMTLIFKGDDQIINRILEVIVTERKKALGSLGTIQVEKNKITHGVDDYGVMVAYVEGLKTSYQEMISKPLTIPPWQKNVEQYEISEASLKLQAARITQQDGQVSYELRGGTFTSFKINDRSVETWPVSIQRGETISVRQDSPEGWEDIHAVFQGDHLDQVEAKFVSRGSQNQSLQIETQVGGLPDQAFGLTFSVVRDYRTEKIFLEGASLTLKGDKEIFIAMGIDPEETANVVTSTPVEMTEGLEIKFVYPSNNQGLGDITFTLHQKEGGWTAVRNKIPGDMIADLPDGLVVSAGSFNVEIPVETHVALQGDGKTRYFVSRDVRGVDYVKVLQTWGGLVGIPVPSLEEGVDLQIEISETDRGFIRFIPVKRNPDGTIPMEAFYLKELEYQIIREAIEGASFKGAGRHELVMVDKSPHPFSMIAQYQIRPGEIFLPTPDTLAWIRDIFKLTPPGESPFKKGERLERRLEFESSEGLVISIPVKWLGRSGNPFGLDADGQFKLDSEGNIILENGIPVLGHGRRIETYIRGQEATTRRPVDYDFRAHEDGGFWTFYAMEHDPKTGGRKAFNLSVALHQKSPVLMALVDTRDEKGEETPESRMEARKSGRLALDQRILDVFSGRDDLPNVFVIPHQLIEGEGDHLQLAFVSETSGDSWTSTELRGFALDKTARRLDFEPELLLKLGRVDEGGVVQTEEIRLQHAISRRDRVVILREILDGIRRGRTFVWNLMLGTLVEIKPTEGAVSEDEVLAIIRNNNLPILEKITPDTSEGIRRDKVKHKGGSYIELENGSGIPVLPDRYLGFQLPLERQIERVREGQKIRDLFRKYPLHNQFFIPDEASVYAMMLVGRDEEYMTFMTHSGIVLQIPMKELPVFEAPPAVVAGGVTPTQIGARYVFDKEPDPVYGVKGARLLIPNRRDDSTVYSALVNHPYSGLDYGVRDYQREALEIFERSFTGRGAGRSRDSEGTIVLPTGAGKTRIIVGSLALAVKHSGFKPGDKLIVTTHLKNITAQNVSAIVEDFAPLFKKLTGRDLTYNIIAGDETPDLSGDLLFVSIPKVTHRGTGRRRTYNFGQELKKALGDEGRVVLTAMDEIHHLRADTWQETRKDIAHASPSIYFLGLTATPSGQETNKLYERKPLELMRLGALPDINLVEVTTGISLDSIAPKTGATFNSRELLSVINTASRNRLVMQSLEKFGIRVEGNPQLLAPTLLFSHDIRHALDLAEAYATYFGKGTTYEGTIRSHYRESYPLRGRVVEVIGTSLAGDSYRSSSGDDIERAVARKKAGEISALVAVVTGQMGDRAREKILEYWKAGIIETVVSDQAYGEGFDGWFLRNLVDADVTLSPTEKAQKGGRITRRGKGEVDTKTGRLLLEPRRIVIDMRDYLRRHGAQLQTFRNAYGYTHKTIPAGTLWNLKEEKRTDQVITHYEVEPVVVHPKRGGGAHHNNLELTIDLGGGERMVVDLKQMGTEQNYGKKEVFGFHAVDKKRAAPPKSPNAQAELKEWIDYLNMHADPRLISTGSVMEEGRRQILLSDGGKLNLEVSRIGDGEYKLNGVQTHAGRGELPPRALLIYTDAEGNQTPYEVYLPPNESSMLLLRHPETGKWQLAFVDRDGHFCLTDRRDYIHEFLTHRASGNFPMVKIIGGEEYASHARSVVTRRPLLTRETASKTFEITAVLGRQEGTSAVSLMGGAEGEKPHIRFVVSELENGELAVERGEKKESDQGSYFPFGDDYEIDIVEDKWLDARTNEIHRGRVRVVFRQNASADLRPYGWIEFESREQLVGESGKFTVHKAHYHETAHYQKRKLMPQADQFLIDGAGHLIGENLFQGGKFVGQGLFDKELMHEKLGDLADGVFEHLSGTRGRKEDIPHLLRVLSLLTFVNYQELVPEVGEELISEEGRYKEEVLAELAHFAKSVHSPPSGENEIDLDEKTDVPEKKGNGDDVVGAPIYRGSSLSSRSRSFAAIQRTRSSALRSTVFRAL